MDSQEREALLAVWGKEHERTMSVLESLPEGQYDFRPDPENRSIGEMAWHLAEGEGFMTNAVSVGTFDPGSSNLEELKRPKTIAGLAPAFDKAHQIAVARVTDLTEEQLGASITFPDGSEAAVGDVLWTNVIGHTIHHRGQLMLLTRQAGETVPGIYGPNREAFPLQRLAGAS
jgi:uncharacterized damage-inducible protein DinB